MRIFEVRPQNNIAEVASNMPAVEALLNRILFSRTFAMPSGSAPFLPRCRYLGGNHIVAERLAVYPSWRELQASKAVRRSPQHG